MRGSTRAGVDDALDAVPRGAGVRFRLGVGACVGLVLIAAVAAILTSVFAGQGVTELIGESASPHGVAGGAASRPGSLDGGDGAGTEGIGNGGNGGLRADGEDDEAPDLEVEPGGRTAVFVHVLGAVANPGLYRLSDGARVFDVIAAAGGLTAAADPGGVNLARYVSDGEQLYVAAVGEVPPPGLANSGVSGSGGSSSGGAAPGGKVNINTATQAELETLPRVGPTMAQRILDWRDSFGRFNSVEDLMSVTGIGEKTFAGLKDLITT